MKSKASTKAARARRSGVIGNRKADNRPQTLDALEALIDKGRGRDVADSLNGLASSSARFGSALFGKLMESTAVLSPELLGPTQIDKLGHLLVDIMDAGTRAQEAFNNSMVIQHEQQMQSGAQKTIPGEIDEGAPSAFSHTQAAIRKAIEKHG